jgi:hypothetical protein
LLFCVCHVVSISDVELVRKISLVTAPSGYSLK